jgi:hypothetical protein
MLVEEYYGSDFDILDFEKLAVNTFDEDVLQKELGLFKTKWFSYRHLHPTNATYLYGHHYLAEFRKTYRKCFDNNRGKYIHWAKGGSVNKKVDPIKASQGIGIWKGRQAADSIGAPYDFYIRSAFDVLIEENIWKHIPRPVHFYSEELKEIIAMMWQETLDADIKEPQISHLSDDNIFAQNLKLEIGFWLCERIKRKLNPIYALANFIFERQLITEQQALQFFNQDDITKAYKFFLNNK